ncbi:MAG: hypothetical protein CME06_03160 [Gemmatimonadetes bacterium]|nr:hypothetical protein [Gemmatimonadota bacterium]
MRVISTGGSSAWGGLPGQLVAHADPVDHGFIGRPAANVGVLATPADLKTAHQYRLREAEAPFVRGPLLVDLELFDEIADRPARRELHIVENDIQSAIDSVTLGTDLDDDIGGRPLIL